MKLGGCAPILTDTDINNFHMKLLYPAFSFQFKSIRVKMNCNTCNYVHALINRCILTMIHTCKSTVNSLLLFFLL